MRCLLEIGRGGPVLAPMNQRNCWRMYKKTCSRPGDAPHIAADKAIESSIGINAAGQRVRVGNVIRATVDYRTAYYLREEECARQ
jgi:hypothetical protein